MDGFLGSRASLMLDVVVLAMFVVLPVMGWSIYQVKHHRRYGLHKTIQLSLGIILAVTITLFEIDMRTGGWKDRTAGGQPSFAVWTVLSVHLVFAVSTAILWVYVLVQAWRKFPTPVEPSSYSKSHIFWARLAAVDMVLTTVTGWVFYLVAFVF